VSDPVTYTAVLPVAEETVQLVSALLAAERRRRRTRPKRRALGCYRQAVLVLRWFLDGARLAQLAADNDIGASTAYRYLHEGIDVLADRAPGLRGALLAARAAGHSHVTVEGTLIRTDRCHVPGPRPGPTDPAAGWACGGWASTPSTAATCRSSPRPTAGPSGPLPCGPAASTTPPRCAPTPRRCRCWPSGPTRPTPPWPISATRASARR
jgi:hypothetical protein